MRTGILERFVADQVIVTFADPAVTSALL